MEHTPEEPEDREAIEEALVEHFAFSQYEIAEKLGIKPQPDGGWSDEDAHRIMDEIIRQLWPGFVPSFTY